MSEINSKIRASVVNQILDTDLVNEECELFYFERSDGLKRHQAVTTLKEHPAIAVISSLPTDTTNIFITVLDGDTTLVRQILATIEDINSESVLKFGNVQLFDSPELQIRDIRGAIFLSTETSNILNFLPQQLKINGIDYQFLLVTFITFQEYMIWQERGHDGLMDYFIEVDKDLISFDFSMDMGNRNFH